MKHFYAQRVAAKALYFLFLMLSCVLGSAQIVQTFSYTGSMQSFTVPSCVSFVTLDVRGAAGHNAADNYTANSTGGLGGRALGVLAVTQGQVLNIFVGGQGSSSGTGGYNGGGAGGSSSAGSSCFGGPAGGGGGASDVRVGGITLANREIVAGGGGGAGRDYCNGSCQPCGCGGSGGDGGGLNGNLGTAANSCGFGYPGQGINGGQGGGNAGAGTGGSGDNGGTSGSSGNANVGGAGAGGTYDVAGGGGGGGYFGGGGGGGASSGSGVGGGGGGGGSSYLGTLTNTTTAAGFQSGNGLVILSYQYNGLVVSAAASPTAICNGNSATLSGNAGLVSYTWMPGNMQTQNTVVSPGTTTSYTLSGTNTLGCISQAVVELTVNAGAPSLTIAQSASSVCPNQTVMLNATGGLSHSWSGGITNGVAFIPASTTAYTVTGTNGCGSTTSVVTITVAPLPVVAISSSSVVCAGYPATLTAAGAANYTWTPNTGNPLIGTNVIVGPTVATTYTVNGSAGICSGVNTINIAVNPNPTLTAVGSQTFDVCENSTITLTASGAATYSWSHGLGTNTTVVATPTANTIYMVTGWNSFGCFASAQQIVLTKSSPILTLQSNKASICAGQQAVLTAGGAISYTWLPANIGGLTHTVLPTVPTTYSVIGSNTANCESTKTIAVNVFTVPLTVSPATAICVGNSVNISAQGANAGTTYMWITGQTQGMIMVSPPTNTVYYVTATTNTLGMPCQVTGSVAVNVNPLPNVTAVANRTALCRNETVSLTASGANTYAWSNFSTNTVIPYKGTNNGNFTLTVTGTDANGCVKTASIALKVSACTDINEVDHSSGISVFPNPTTGAVTVHFSVLEPNTVMSVVDVAGKLIMTQKVTQQNHQINLEKESKGIYFIEFRQSENLIYTQKVIKE